MTSPLPDAAMSPVEVAAAATDDALQQPALHAAVLAGPGADDGTSGNLGL